MKFNINLKTLLIIFSLVGGYTIFVLNNKSLMYKVPNGVYNIKRISCPEDLNLTNPLISRTKVTLPFDNGLTFSYSLDFDNIIKRQLVIDEGVGKIVLASEDCSAFARFKISKNEEYKMLFNVKDVYMHSANKCKFKKTFKDKTIYMDRFGHFALADKFFESYWVEEDVPTIEWTPKKIDNRIIIEIKLRTLTDVPCSKESKIIWEIEKIKKL